MQLFKNIKLSSFIAIGTACTLLGTGIGYAAGEWQNIWVQVNSVNLNVNGKMVSSPNLLYNDRTYVPLRTCAEMLGSSVNWDQYSNTANIVANNASKNTNDTKTVGIIMYRLDEMLKLSSRLGSSYSMCISFLNCLRGNYANKEKIYSDAIDYFNKAINDYNNYISYIDDLVSNAQKINLDFTKVNEIMEYYGDAIDKTKLAYENLVLYDSTSIEQHMKDADNLIDNAYDSIIHGNEIRLDLLNKIFEYTQIE